MSYKLILQIVLGGIAGTLVMTLYMYIISRALHKPLRVVKILGTMLTADIMFDRQLCESRQCITIGTLAHYLIGIATCAFFLLGVELHVLAVSFIDSIIFSIAVSISGVLLWMLFFRLHPDPPDIPKRSYFSNIIIGHLFFGLGMYVLLVLVD